MQIWSDLVASALLGTERRTLQLGHVDGALSTVLHQLDPSEPEAALLGTAAILAQHRRAGWVAPLSQGMPSAPALAETMPRCSEATAHRLTLIFESNRTGILAEWLAALATAGQRLPVDHLPRLLGWGAQDPGRRESILVVIGERGRWLAAQNPDWSYLWASGDPDSTWQTGSRAGRLAALTQLRRDDPTRARNLLMSTWSAESADDRARFLQTLLVNLGPDDEVFLDGALDDRSVSVRRAAASLLRRLPGSALVRRMATRVEPLLSYRPAARGLAVLRGRGRARFELVLPTERDAAMIRDGVESQANRPHELGDRGWWLYQMVQAIPPVHWCQLWQIDPKALLEAAARGEWRKLFVPAWADATVVYRDAEWAEAIIELDPSYAALLDLLPVERAERLLLPILKDHGRAFRPGQPAYDLTIGYSRPWSLDIGRAVLGRLRAQFGRRGPDRLGLDLLRHQLLPLLALRLPPALADEAETGWATDDPDWTGWDRPVGDFLATLRFRHDMLEEINR